MSEIPTIDWPGHSGKSYTYWIYELPPNFNAEPGNYIFAKLNNANEWEPVYIGQTGDLSERFDNHHQMQCIQQNGATHIHVHTNATEEARLAEERDLTSNFDTPCP